MSIRVLIADDQALVRAGVRGVLQSAEGIEVVCDAADGVAAVDGARETQPDVVVMDIRMPEMDGIEATRVISADPSLAGTRILMLTTFDADETVFEALRVGASGFLLKDATAEEMISAVRVVASGDALLAPSVTRRLVERFARSTPTREVSPEALGALTEREREVLGLVAKGLSNDEIAQALFISPATAKTHVSHVLTKLAARDRAQLVTIAYESGVVTPGP